MGMVLKIVQKVFYRKKFLRKMKVSISEYLIIFEKRSQILKVKLPLERTLWISSNNILFRCTVDTTMPYAKSDNRFKSEAA
jgi:hypothetical protein